MGGKLHVINIFGFVVSLLKSKLFEEFDDGFSFFDDN
jgi:hypothetical protein